VQIFGKTLTIPVWKASLGRERHSVTYLLELEEDAYCLRLSYSGGLKIRNNNGSESLGTPCHSVWVGDSYEGGHGKGDGIKLETPPKKKGDGLIWSCRKFQAEWGSGSKGCSDWVLYPPWQGSSSHAWGLQQKLSTEPVADVFGLQGMPPDYMYWLPDRMRTPSPGPLNHMISTLLLPQECKLLCRVQKH
jgi:hypothetical protein